MGMAKKIKALALEKDVTIKELSKRLGYSSTNLYNKMQRDNFSEKELRAIAEALDCDYDAYFIVRDTGKKI